MNIEMPTPIDVSRLKNIIGGARAIMDKVESGNYKTGQVDGRALNDDGVREMMAEGVTRPQQAVAPQINYDNQPMYKNMSTSKMPSAIKEAMMATPIPQMSGPQGHTFNLDDVQDMIPNNQRAPQYPSTPKTQYNQQYNQPVYEQRQQQMGSNNDGTFTVSESGLKAIIKDCLLEFMTQTFTQNLSEDVIKKTITTLVKEGKLNIKKKI